MNTDVHNPDQFMVSLRQIIAQGRKRVGLLVGAGAGASVHESGSDASLIPAVADLTKLVIGNLKKEHGNPLDGIRKELIKEGVNPNIEAILSRVRSLANIIGSAKVYGLDAKGHRQLGEAICAQIGTAVDKDLPKGPSPYKEIVTWINGADRAFPIEIFTTNYDLLFEKAFESAKAPYFDGFTGASEPFFDPASISNNDLPLRWTRLWKLHGSLGWTSNAAGEVVRICKSNAPHLVFPEHLKYDQTQKAPYSALFDRFRTFLMTPDSLLIATGFSFADSHVSARIDECLAANPSCAVLAFQFQALENEPHASSIAARRGNMSVYCPDMAVINGVAAPWMPGDPPTKDWLPIRRGYWGNDSGSAAKFLLGDFVRLARFFASSRSTQRMVPQTLDSEHLTDIEESK